MGSQDGTEQKHLILCVPSCEIKNSEYMVGVKRWGTRLSGVENEKHAELAGVPEPTNGEDHKQDGKPRWHGAKSLDCVRTQLRNPDSAYMVGVTRGKFSKWRGKWKTSRVRAGKHVKHLKGTGKRNIEAKIPKRAKSYVF